MIALTKSTARPPAAAKPLRDDQPIRDRTRIKIFTDDSRIENPGHGAYGPAIVREGISDQQLKLNKLSAPSPTLTTNFRMKLAAACVAPGQPAPATGEPVSVCCDTDLPPNAMKRWLPKSKAAELRRCNGKPIENRDRRERMDRAAAGLSATWTCVRGHSGNAHNETSDRPAYAAARKAERAARPVAQR